MELVPITYFSDVLCIWAYIAQLRVNAVKAAFGERVRIEPKFCTVFGATERKITATWGAENGYERFNAHLRHVAGQFPEVSISPDIWMTVRPASSTSAHVFLKAVHLVEAAENCAAGAAEAATWTLRQAFFESAEDIADWKVQSRVAERLGLNPAAVRARMDDGAAFAALAEDLQEADAMRISGSPSFVLNEGRQKLYGNVGYRVLEANIQELLRAPAEDQASWC